MADPLGSANQAYPANQPLPNDCQHERQHERQHEYEQVQPPHLHQSHSSFEADDEQSQSQTRSQSRSQSQFHGDPDNVSDASSDYHPVHSRRRRPRINTDTDTAAGMTPRHRRLGSGAGTAVPAYPGEDVRPTSPKEIMGWYMYSFASETYVICAIASFIPILLESLARENGVLLSDRTTPCKASNAHSLSAVSLSGPIYTRKDPSQCIVYVLGIEVNTASFAMYSFSVSVLLQALLVVSISCAADHGNYRKKLLLGFAWSGSLAVMLYLAVSADTFLFGAFLAIVSNTSFGASFVLLNSFLPLLVRHHPLLLFGKDEPPSSDDADDDDEPRQIQLYDEENEPTHGDSFDGDDPTQALLSRSRSPDDINNNDDNDNTPRPSSALRSHKEQTSLELALSTQISSKGIGIGYCAALFVQCVAIFVVYKMHNSIWSLRVVLFGIGAWWGLFTIPAAMWLRPRPGPPLPAAATASAGQSGGIVGWTRSWLAYLVYAWSSLFRTMRLARRLVDIVLFLAGWFLLSDAIATTSSTAVLFAKTQLHMEVWALGMINVISTTTGVVGAFSWAYVSRRFGLTPLHTIMACLALFELIPLYGLSGYLPFVRGWGVGGLQQPWEMYPLAAVYGLVLGGLSSYCRSLYGELIPPGSEAAFYALYAITDKGSSVFGPAIVGAIIDASGEIRPAFFFLAALVGLPAGFLYFVDVERGKREGSRLAAFIEGFASQPESFIVAGGDTDSSPQTPRAILGDYDDDDEQH